MEKIIFENIENEDIFVSDYKKLIRNNEIDFSREGISVIYGPNGTGKTSLVKVLSSEKGTKVKYTYGGEEYTDGSQFFVINDQNNRNIIQGETKDFLLGDNIKKEFELQEYIENEYNRLCTESISILKNNYNVSSSSNKSIDCFSEWASVQNIIKDLMNNRSKGTKTGVDAYILEFEKHTQITIHDYEQDKLDYIISDLSEKNPLIIEIETIDTNKLSNNSHIKEIEENTEAIKILSRFSYKDQCIVCDSNEIDYENLLSKKSKNKEEIIKTLDAKTKKIVEKIIANVSEKEPFRIKDIMLGAIETGNLSDVLLLKKSIKEHKNIFANKAIKELVQLYKSSDIKIKNEEYQKLINQKPDITEEDFLYIEQIISNNMSKKLQIIRDDKKNIKIVLENKDFLGINREELPLSSGEQNFLSLTFEFLKAKNSDKPIIILDDPISSFDSIYKNKIAYAIVKILQNKKRVILTHNVDLLRLLDGQLKKCFRLFLFNNTENEENGFIALNSDERDMLINLDELLKTFREKIYEHIKDVELFLISLIPFMRGYSTMINDNDIKENLTQLMHGYKTNTVDIAECYIKLFGNKNNIIPNNYKVNVDDMLNKTVDGKEIVDKEKYPLLNRTLVHSFTYLFLRLLIEKKLVSKYNIDTESKSGAKQLGQIISKAFPENSKNSDNIKNRVFLTTKKTLLNEFNHFEGNMSIFQPAIDITDHMLGKEKTDILAFVNKL
ncbi:AAA family ATPase [Campylobacter geochelonis]|uniref:Hemin importer ATP-binding subunit n=1 Tax=Campylobacter geochelonis TaxID=1780362 RepID=A0A128EK19_9BACT|nr:AAA family ATPase [Campylobacter geochelonis]QKF71627.1 putative wobble nucleotide-excising tRNase, RloC family [Campylobacter geochelonis]CZE48688.1 hemin importer ATP-binding subunit [Campylobacter geochelonis]